MEIIVQGKGTEYFTPNEIIISINFYKKGNSYEEVLNSGLMSVQNFVNNILLPNSFSKEDMKTRSFVVREEQKYDNMTREYSFDGFSFSQLASIKFDYDKTKLASIMEQLSKMVLETNVGEELLKEIYSYLHLKYNIPEIEWLKKI